MALLARLHGFSLWKLLRYIREELLVVLGTSSTEPVLPAMLYKLEKLGCSKGCVGLTLPLGYSFNLDGTAIYLTLASVFLAQAMDIQLTQWQILSMIAVMLLTSKGAAGVTGSGFAALVATLAAMPDTVPVAGVVIIAGIDRFMSEARALTSLCSNAVACCRCVDLGRGLRQGRSQARTGRGLRRRSRRTTFRSRLKLPETDGNPALRRGFPFATSECILSLAQSENDAMTTRKLRQFRRATGS